MFWSTVTRNGVVEAQGAPRIQPFLFSKNVTFGQTIKTFCSAVGKEPLSFQWHKDGLPIYNSQNVKIVNHDDYSVLSLTSVDYNSPGNYTCIVKNTEGSATYSAELVIHGELEKKKSYFSTEMVSNISQTIIKFQLCR
ncbi:down syndrome cell adhesion molecule [Trichonephila clavata]|uniref:Down syndrome cell adhesion molecule n=1 Tax=Trichonephila clavata TaxID=2740835 RepID=A0A8X6I5D4_TRICU|nr:down syndrome cell adhesion molecule [Trichonephila clavata]